MQVRIDMVQPLSKKLKIAAKQKLRRNAREETTEANEEQTLEYTRRSESKRRTEIDIIILLKKRRVQRYKKQKAEKEMDQKPTNP